MAACAPEVFAPLRQSFLSHRITLKEMMDELETNPASITEIVSVK